MPSSINHSPLENFDYISSAELSEEDPEDNLDPQEVEGSIASTSHTSSGTNTSPEGQEEVEPIDEEPEHPHQEPPNQNLEMAQQLQIVAGFVKNPRDTTALRRYAFPGNRLSSQMITRFIDIPYFTVVENDTIVSRGIVLNMYAKGRCTLERWSTTNSQRTIAALEAIAPNLPASCFAARDDARLYLVLSTLHYLSRNGATSNYHRREAWPVVHINNQVREALNINLIL